LKAFQHSREYGKCVGWVGRFHNDIQNKTNILSSLIYDAFKCFENGKGEETIAQFKPQNLKMSMDMCKEA
jgi:hypothetical protein